MREFYGEYEEEYERAVGPFEVLVIWESRMLITSEMLHRSMRPLWLWLPGLD